MSNETQCQQYTFMKQNEIFLSVFITIIYALQRVLEKPRNMLLLYTGLPHASIIISKLSSTTSSVGMSILNPNPSNL